MVSCLFVTYLDAYKAFDRLNQHKLFTEQITRGAPKWIVRLLCQWYCNQSIIMYQMGIGKLRFLSR